MIPSNYHTHTVYCDGINTPEEIVLEAIRLGCSEIGFSGHSYTFFDERYCMSKEGTDEYKNEVKELREKYKDRIKVLLGVEQDYYSNEPTDDYEYVIGSVHYVLKDGVYLAVDESKDIFIKNVSEHYNGDYYAFIEDYYKLVADLYRKTKCDIIGHFDLITKFNADGALFSTTHPRYINAVNLAIDALKDAPVTFEVNTGGISRGYTAQPYPSKDILEELRHNNKRIIFSSDCHDADKLLFGYDIFLEHISEKQWHK